MPLLYQPKPRTILYCDFSGYIKPEIVKRRPVIILKSHKRNRKLVAVVPLSTSIPRLVEEHHYRLLENPLPNDVPKEVWAKCDLVAVVSTERLDPIPSGKRHRDGKREYLKIQIGPEQFECIRRGVMKGLGLVASADFDNLMERLDSQSASTNITLVPARGSQDSE